MSESSQRIAVHKSVLVGRPKRGGKETIPESESCGSFTASFGNSVCRRILAARKQFSGRGLSFAAQYTLKTKIIGSIRSVQRDLKKNPENQKARLERQADGPNGPLSG